MKNKAIITITVDRPICALGYYFVDKPGNSYCCHRAANNHSGARGKCTSYQYDSAGIGYLRAGGLD